MTQPKERPILFSGEMVRAILDGRKTQTRRVVNPQPEIKDGNLIWCPRNPLVKRGSGSRVLSTNSCPYGQPGDRLWVRETHAIVPRTAYAHSDGIEQTVNPNDDHDAAIYRQGFDRSNGGFRWRPSIHMPRWASRILLEVVSVRVERLQDISNDDALSEGINSRQSPESAFWGGRSDFAVREFAGLWESINGPESWDANPWVWVVEFRRVEP